MNKKTAGFHFYWPLLGLFIFLYAAIDLLRKIFGLGGITLLSHDLILGLIYLVSVIYWMHRSNFIIRIPKSEKLFNSFFIFLMLSLIFSIASNFGNFGMLTLLGIKTYLFPIPMILVGYFISKELSNEKLQRNVLTFLYFIYFFILAIFFIQYFASNFLGIEFLPSQEHESRSYLDESISLFSSVFFSSKKFLRFLLLLTLLIWITQSLRSKSNWVLFLTAFVSLLSGTRDVTVLICAFIVIIYFRNIYIVRLSNNTLMSANIFRFFILIFLSLFLIVGLIFISQLRYLLNVDEPIQLVIRVLAFFPFLFVDWSNLIIGIGPGSYGQESVFLNIAMTDSELGFVSDISVGGLKLSIIIVSGINIWLIVIGFIILISLIPITWNLLHNYQQNRILTFLNPENDPLGSGYHIAQSKIAIGSGGFTGKGYMQGSQSQLEFIPEIHTDFVFSILSEEFGFLGSTIIILLHFYLFYYGMKSSFYANNEFDKLVVFGLTINYFFYFLINISMVIGLVPVVGVPLPIISYGGSSMLAIIISFAIIQKINIKRKIN